MNKNILLALTVAVAVGFTSCEDQLDTENFTQSNTRNFPTTFSDAEMLVTTMYANLNHAAAKPESSYYMTTVLASDDLYGGLGQQFDHLQSVGDTQFDFCWKNHYTGVSASNLAIEGLTAMKDKVADMEYYNQLLGESYFMRAYYYSELAEMFGRVPLMLSTTQESNTPRAEIDDVYGLIASDLKRAIGLMANKRYDTYPSGHATKWAAEALLARAYLFYTGFYNKDSMPLYGEEGSVSKSDVVAYLDDCIANSGHDLVSDFRNLWSYTNEYTVNDYAYTAGKTDKYGNPLKWAGNGNQETVFAVKFGNFAGYTYDNQGGYANLYRAFFGFQNKSGHNGSFPFGMGNAWGTVTRCLWDEWIADEPDDMRRVASIANQYDEFDMSLMENGEVTGMYEDTGLWNKKMMPVLANSAYDKYGNWANSLFWCAYPEYDGSGYVQPQWGALFEDLIIIRFADVLLMHSELTATADGMNRVRARAGLPEVAYSLERLQKERRYELAFEGTRWADIRRWHIAEEALAKQNGATVNNLGRDVVMTDGRYVSRYKATNGFFPIPLAQIQLSNGVLTQNDGWETPESYYTVWNFN